MKVPILGLAAAALLVSPALHAWESTVAARPLLRPPVRINRLERREQRLIREEFREGALTRQEVRRLEHEQARIRRQAAYDKADGTLTRAEHQ